MPANAECSRDRIQKKFSSLVHLWRDVKEIPFFERGAEVTQI